MLRLTMRRGPTNGTSYRLSADEVTIGRASKNTIIIDDNQVSRYHARLVRVGSGYELYDIDSTAGTFVNGQRIQRAWRLSPGELIELGESITLEYGFEDDIIGETSIVCRLMMIEGPATGYSFSLTGASVGIGRAFSNDIVVQSTQVSRNHTRLLRVGNSYAVEDLGSTNGTFVNEQRLYEVRLLEDGDTLTLGMSVRFRFMQVIAPDTDAKAPAPLTEVLNDDTLTETRPMPLPASLRRATGVEPGALRDHIWLLYDRVDWDRLVAPLTMSLQDSGIQVWADQYLPRDTPNWQIAIDQAINECWLMVVVVTTASVKSPHVISAVRAFNAKSKPILRVMTDTTPVTGEIATITSTIQYERGNGRSIHKLVYAIMEQRSQRD